VIIRASDGPVLFVAFLFAAVGVNGAATEMVCVAPDLTDLPSWVSKARHVAVAKVESARHDDAGWGTTYKLTPVRVYKGRRRPELRAHTSGCEDCGSLRVGDYVLVFAPSETFEFDSCSQPRALYDNYAREAVTLLDRRMNYLPLSVPEEALKPPQ
jgi:hypothetical protein